MSFRRGSLNRLKNVKGLNLNPSILKNDIVSTEEGSIEVSKKKNLFLTNDLNIKISSIEEKEEFLKKEKNGYIIILEQVFTEKTKKEAPGFSHGEEFFVE